MWHPFYLTLPRLRLNHGTSLPFFISFGLYALSACLHSEILRCAGLFINRVCVILNICVPHTFYSPVWLTNIVIFAIQALEVLVLSCINANYYPIRTSGVGGSFSLLLSIFCNPNCCCHLQYIQRLKSIFNMAKAGVAAPIKCLHHWHSSHARIIRFRDLMHHCMPAIVVSRSSKRFEIGI